MTGRAGMNWAGNHGYAASEVLRPRDVEEVRRIVRRGTPVRALGSRHSFNDLADTTGELVTLEDFPPEVEVDEQARVVAFQAGMRYGELAAVLQDKGWALSNLASLPHISVAGAVATGTHGSGVRNRSLAAAVAAVELVDGAGDLVTLRRGDADFDGAVVSLGAIGIVTRLTLDIEPTFDVRQDVYQGIGWPDLLDHFDQIMAGAYSVSVFTEWAGDSVGLVWLKSRAGDAAPPDQVYGAVPATADLHVIQGMPAHFTTQQRGVPGRWNERLAHFRMEFTPSSGEELQSELLVPRSRAQEAVLAVRDLADDVAPVLHVTELRTVAADTLWLSGAYDADVLGIHFTWRKMPREVARVLTRVEERLLPLGARPHWGKVFQAGVDELAPLYPRLDDFRALARRHDPKGLFRNEFLARSLGL
jgi:alditol oxidase